jgi:uncharacterized OB-fold protein
MSDTKNRVPVREGLWTQPTTTDGKSQLIGSRCVSCGELFFPKQDSGLCSYCQSRDLEEVRLGSRGKIYSFTVVMQRPPVYYQAEVPYAIGFVELPEGIRIETLFTGCDLDFLRIGMDVEMVLERLYEDEEGAEVVAYR